MTHTADAAPQCSASVPVCTATTLGMVHVQGVQLVSVCEKQEDLVFSHESMC